MINPGLAPWAMQEYRPYRAPLRPPNQYALLFRCGFVQRIQKKGLSQRLILTQSLIIEFVPYGVND